LLHWFGYAAGRFQLAQLAYSTAMDELGLQDSAVLVSRVCNVSVTNTTFKDWLLSSWQLAQLAYSTAMDELGLQDSAVLVSRVCNVSATNTTFKDC
jgi:heterodisulfide reductase subunit B